IPITSMCLRTAIKAPESANAKIPMPVRAISTVDTGPSLLRPHGAGRPHSPREYDTMSSTTHVVERLPDADSDRGGWWYRRAGLGARTSAAGVAGHSARTG